MTNPWRVAKSLLELRDEVDRRSPDRSKASDGTIGNAAHAARTSDHNPWVQDGGTGVVTAMDITNDPEHGFDSSDFADWLRKRCKSGMENRVKYVISDRRIASATHENWAWRAYSGSNPHEHHVHISVLSTKNHYDNTSSWGWDEEDDVSKADAVAALQDKSLVRNIDAEGKTTGTNSPVRFQELADQKLDFIKATVKAQAKTMAGLQGSLNTLSAAVQALAAGSADGVRQAFAEGVANLKTELADIDVQVTLGDRTDESAG
jgi:hypothetical protein